MCFLCGPMTLCVKIQRRSRIPQSGKKPKHHILIKNPNLTTNPPAPPPIQPLFTCHQITNDNEKDPDLFRPARLFVL